MTNAITYPAAYNVLSCEEMTYTEGGVGVVEAAMAWFPLYGWYKAVSAIHDYRKANINSNWVENGMNALVAHAEKSPTNTIHDIGCSFWFIGSCATMQSIRPTIPGRWAVCTALSDLNTLGATWNFMLNT